ncbi:UDP-galactopyranose mutase [Pseudalkalibacillus berkeleyi]|uniref:UDP-galactopyranose mutase n=1 Tax=Pseudalkalibacillus berkeleyi TaxID=1069813 RepID=A0ABS9GVP6_9BACL|nr:UDP-galactopyranose mutase [Pseudalkalibacillus berkeleyi]MCF6136879.1 UDP-galactopyranose mutase [Pseudalkalibacillus berkeleyi]
MKFDWLIIGAGFSGCVLAEQIANRMNQKVLIIEKRDHIGGNAYDCYDPHGILVHQYGPHLFHTNSKKVWHYLTQFTDWTCYQHHVLAVIDGKTVPVPFNLNALRSLFPIKYADRLEEKLTKQYGFGKKVPILELMDVADEEMKELAEYIYKNVFYGYTVKQWGMKPDELDRSVMARVPIHISRDNRYFQDQYQGVPMLGYKSMFNNMISHPNIKVLLKTDYDEVKEYFHSTNMIYTGPIDAFFDYKFGKLPYRSLNFTARHLHNCTSYQPVAQVNYPNNYEFTRITEYKKITGQNVPGTTIMHEEACSYTPGVNVPYYPIPRKENNDLYTKYKMEAKKLKENVLFVGRLAEYKYYNMDQVVARALHVFENEIAKQK